MQKLGDALIQTGRHSYNIRRQYAQALIDQNNLTSAIAILKELENDTANAASSDDDEAKEENMEARGLLGRSYKQLYVNANNPRITHNHNFLKQAIKFYLDVYSSDPEVRTWHGINTVALLARANRDNITTDGFPSPKDLANSVLKTIEEKYEEGKADGWDFATAAEACVELAKPNDALEWMSGYARMPICDAFEIASTLRQFEEVWQLDMNSEVGRIILPLLRAELLKREGGNLLIDAEELKSQRAAEDTTTNKYNSLVKTQTGNNLEKVFGDDSFKTYKWYTTGVDRCLAVARIGRDSSKGFGTGFLLKGMALHESLSDELILITNAHVVSDDPVEKALKPYEAVIIFEAIDRNQEFKPSEIIYSSPSNELDVTILRFDKDEHKKLKELTNKINIYPVSKYLPVVEEPPSQRIYIIGHPFGGTLQLSFQDNILLDHQNPKLHYRTPTEGGSSGSPVFNQQWDLIGLHHAGSEEMSCLNGKPGTYNANEGIWIQAIKDALKLKLEP
jgi:V8-like Glu-specific endopeptidase